MEKASYLKEIYTDDYNTLQQAIIIDIELDRRTNGYHSREERSRINPNLHLSKIIYLNNKMEVIKNETRDTRTNIII
jgi:hypothetical protein